MADSIPKRLLRQASERPSTIAYQAKVDGRWQPTTWRTYADQVRTAARQPASRIGDELALDRDDTQQV